MILDEQLIVNAINGNKDSFAKIIDSNKMDFLKIARTRLKEDDAYDAIQDTIVSAYNSIHKLKDPSKFKSWIITILINKCNDIYNVQNKNGSYNIEDYQNSLYENVNEDSLDINDILKVLNYDEKAIITLYILESFTTKEIAQILKMNENTVKTKISRAKEKIRKCYGGEYNG